MIELYIIVKAWNLFTGKCDFQRLRIYAPYIDGDMLKGIDERGQPCGIFVSNVVHVQPAARCRRNSGTNWDYIAVLDGNGREEARL